MTKSEDNYKVTSYTRHGEDKIDSIKETIKKILDNDKRKDIIDDFDIIFVTHENDFVIHENNDNIDKIKGFALCEILDTEKSNIDTEKSNIKNKCNNIEKSLFIDSFIINNQNNGIDELLLNEIIRDFKDKNINNYKYIISSSKLKNFKNHYKNGFLFIDCSGIEIGNKIINNNDNIFEIPDKLTTESPIVELCNQLIKNNLLTTRLDNSRKELYTSGFKMTLKQENIPQTGGGCNK